MCSCAFAVHQEQHQTQQQQQQQQQLQEPLAKKARASVSTCGAGAPTLDQTPLCREAAVKDQLAEPTQGTFSPAPLLACSGQPAGSSLSSAGAKEGQPGVLRKGEQQGEEGMGGHGEGVQGVDDGTQCGDGVDQQQIRKGGISSWRASGAVKLPSFSLHLADERCVRAGAL